MLPRIVLEMFIGHNSPCYTSYQKFNKYRYVTADIKRNSRTSQIVRIAHPFYETEGCGGGSVSIYEAWNPRWYYYRHSLTRHYGAMLL